MSHGMGESVTLHFIHNRQRERASLNYISMCDLTTEFGEIQEICMYVLVATLFTKDFSCLHSSLLLCVSLTSRPSPFLNPINKTHW